MRLRYVNEFLEIFFTQLIQSRLSSVIDKCKMLDEKE